MPAPSGVLASSRRRARAASAPNALVPSNAVGLINDSWHVGGCGTAPQGADGGCPDPLGQAGRKGPGVQEQPSLHAVAESVAEEAESSGVGLVRYGGGFDFDGYDPAARALNDDVDLDAGAVPEMREGKRFVDENGLPHQFGYDVAFEEEPGELAGGEPLPVGGDGRCCEAGVGYVDLGPVAGLG